MYHTSIFYECYLMINKNLYFLYISYSISNMVSITSNCFSFFYGSCSSSFYPLDFIIDFDILYRNKKICSLKIIQIYFSNIQIFSNISRNLFDVCIPSWKLSHRSSSYMMHKKYQTIICKLCLNRMWDKENIIFQFITRRHLLIIKMWYILEIPKKQSNPIKWKKLGFVVWKQNFTFYLRKYQFSINIKIIIALWKKVHVQFTLRNSIFRRITERKLLILYCPQYL